MNLARWNKHRDELKSSPCLCPEESRYNQEAPVTEILQNFQQESREVRNWMIPWIDATARRSTEIYLPSNNKKIRFKVRAWNSVRNWRVEFLKKCSSRVRWAGSSKNLTKILSRENREFVTPRRSCCSLRKQGINSAPWIFSTSDVNVTATPGTFQLTRREIINYATKGLSWITVCPRST